MKNKWKITELGDVCKFNYGKGLPKRKRINGIYPVYGSGGIVDYNKEYYIEGPGIIVGRKGTIGSVYFEKRKFFPIDTVFYIEENKSVYNIRFLYYLLSNLGLNRLNSDAAVPGLNRNIAYQQKILLPALDVQNKISSILSTYDDLIENNARRIQILEEMAQLIYREWFVNFEFPSPPDKGELEGVKFIPYSPKLKEYARHNRKNATPAEKRMWELLSRKQLAGLKFTRQKPLENFIVDFYCSELLLGIEIDGDTHAFQEKYDELRSDILKKKYGIEIIRYTNTDVLSNTEGVYLDLVEHIKRKTLPCQGGDINLREVKWWIQNLAKFQRDGKYYS